MLNPRPHGDLQETCARPYRVHRKGQHRKRTKKRKSVNSSYHPKKTMMATKTNLIGYNPKGPLLGNG